MHLSLNATGMKQLTKIQWLEIVQFSKERNATIDISYEPLV